MELFYFFEESFYHIGECLSLDKFLTQSIAFDRFNGHLVECLIIFETINHIDHFFGRFISDLGNIVIAKFERNWKDIFENDFWLIYFSQII